MSHSWSTDHGVTNEVDDGSAPCAQELGNIWDDVVSQHCHHLLLYTAVAGGAALLRFHSVIRHLGSCHSHLVITDSLTQRDPGSCIFVVNCVMQVIKHIRYFSTNKSLEILNFKFLNFNFFANFKVILLNKSKHYRQCETNVRL